MFETNEYFDGKVKSIAFKGVSKPATVGVMAAGDYVFNTADKEKMWNSVRPKLSGIKGKVIVTSIPEGKNNFHELCKKKFMGITKP